LPRANRVLSYIDARIGPKAAASAGSTVLTVGDTTWNSKLQKEHAVVTAQVKAGLVVRECP